MMTPAQLDSTAAAVAALNGIGPELAGHYAALIGDCPTFVAPGDSRVIVYDDDGRELARIRWPGSAET